MAVRPPQDDDDETPEALAFGISALDARLEDAEDHLSFPATAQELVRALDDPDIPYDSAGHTLALSEALSAVDQREFATETELKRTLHPVYERKRRNSGRGLVGRVRELLPF